VQLELPSIAGGEEVLAQPRKQKSSRRAATEKGGQKDTAVADGGFEEAPIAHTRRFEGPLEGLLEARFERFLAAPVAIDSKLACARNRNLHLIALFELERLYYSLRQADLGAARSVVRGWERVQR
jgi:hypothetical protein